MEEKACEIWNETNKCQRKYANKGLRHYENHVTSAKRLKATCIPSTYKYLVCIELEYIVGNSKELLCQIPCEYFLQKILYIKHKISTTFLCKMCSCFHIILEFLKSRNLGKPKDTIWIKSLSMVKVQLVAIVAAEESTTL